MKIGIESAIWLLSRSWLAISGMISNKTWFAFRIMSTTESDT